MNIIAIKIYGDVLPHIMEGCIDGLFDLGHNVRLVDLSFKEGQIDILKSEIDKFSPDFLFTINHIGLTRSVLKLLSCLKLPYVSWWVDNPLALTTREDFKSEYLTIFSLDRFYVERLKAYGFKNVYYLPLATNPKIFKETELNEEEREEFGCALSFVGGAFYKGFKTYMEYQKGGNPILKEVIKETLRLYLDNPSLELIQILQSVIETFRYDLSAKEKRELLVSLELMAMSLYRKEIIEALTDFKLHLYGDDGWRDLVGDGVRFLGRIDYKRLPKLYNASKINLNITKSQLKTGINQRIFDISACGGFVLSDFRHDLSRLFVIDKEVIFYRDRQDLKDKIVYYLSHPEERMNLINQAKERVLRDHTYRKRMEELIEVIESR